METQETNIYDRIQPPKLDTLQVYIDGEIDKRREVRRYTEYGIKLAGYKAYRALVAGCVVIDNFVESV